MDGNPYASMHDADLYHEEKRVRRCVNTLREQYIELKRQIKELERQEELNEIHQRLTRKGNDIGRG